MPHHHNYDAEQIIQLFLSDDSSNVELAYQLQRSLDIDLTDFWADLQDVYALVNSSTTTDESTLLSYGNTSMVEVTVSYSSPVYKDGIREGNRFLQTTKMLTLRGHGSNRFPSWILLFPNLKLFRFSGFFFKSLPAIFRQLKHIQSLDLHNQPINTLPDWLPELKQLRDLDISGTAIRKLPECLLRMPQLKYLRIAANQLTELPEWLGKLKNLKLLDIRSNKLASLPECIAQLKKLEQLYLSGNTDMDWKKAFQQIEKLPNLNYVRWANGEELNISPPLSSCVDFDMSTCNCVNDQDWQFLFQGLSGMRKIKKLSLDGSRLKEIPRAIVSLESLEELSLRDTEIACLPDFLAEMPLLRRIDVGNTNITSVPESFNTKNKKIKVLMG